MKPPKPKVKRVRVWAYTGPAYIRPVGRGVVLCCEQLEDILERTFGSQDIHITIKATLPKKKRNQPKR